LAHLFNLPLVFAETNADDLGQTSRRTHLLSPAMRQAARDGALMLGICLVLVLYRLYIDPTDPLAKGAIDFRFHFVWLVPLVIVALCPWVFHPYIVGGRDLPPRRSRAPKPATAVAHIGTEAPEWAATGRRGAA
jgi:hypothetical protein